MIRVGFVFGFLDDGWLGGLSYYRNLFTAILALPERRIEPVVIIGNERAHDILKDFPSVKVIHSRVFGARSRWTDLRWACYRRLRRDVVAEAVLRRHRVAVLSHSDPIGGSALPVIAWIPDFQHEHLPEFFAAEEVAARHRANAAVAAAADRVLLSSRDAQQDFCRLYPQFAAKSRVLPFVADPGVRQATPALQELEQLYGVAGPYFLVANQFWAHKNHRLIIDALRILKTQGLATPVLASGNPHDHRAPGFYAELMAYARQEDVLDHFKPLGVIPRAHLVGLMRHALAVLNPSRFEGWNTSIEEAKTLGVRVIASDIAVHREQAPAAALYVDPDRPQELAAAMAAVWRERGRPPPDAAANFTDRQRAFGRGYQEVVLGLFRSSARSAEVAVGVPG